MSKASKIATLERDLAPWKGEVVLFRATQPAEDGENVHEGWRTIAQALVEIKRGKWRGWNLWLSILPNGNQVAVPVNYAELEGIHRRMVAVQHKIADLKDTTAHRD